MDAAPGRLERTPHHHLHLKTSTFAKPSKKNGYKKYKTIFIPADFCVSDEGFACDGGGQPQRTLSVCARFANALAADETTGLPG